LSGKKTHTNSKLCKTQMIEMINIE